MKYDGGNPREFAKRFIKDAFGSTTEQRFLKVFDNYTWKNQGLCSTRIVK
jgi:hypothetical protein